MKAFSGVLVAFALGTIALAACSGSLGGSSALPGPASSPGNQTLSSQQAKPLASGAPGSATGNISIGGSPAPQALPTVGDFAGSVFFPAASPAPSPGASASPVSVAVSTAVTAPTAVPELEEHAKKTMLGKTQPAHVVHHPLLYVTFDATSDVTFATFPAFAFNVPSAKISDKTLFGLAFFDPTLKAKAFRLAVAQRDLTPPPSPSPTSSAKAARPAASGSASPAATSSPVPTERVAFDAGTGPFAMKANTTYVFALYSYVPTPSPSPSPTASSVASASPASSAAPASSPAPSSSPTTR